MPRLIFDLTEPQRAKLEGLRAARGHRSCAETLRAMIEEVAGGLIIQHRVGPEIIERPVRLAQPIMRKEPAATPSGRITLQVGPSEVTPGAMLKRK